MKKKILIITLLISIFMCAFLLSACSGEQTTEEILSVYTDSEQGFVYNLIKVTSSNGSTYNYVKLIEFTGKQETGSQVISLVVPSKITVDGTEYNVDVIGSLVFYKVNISEIEISEGVTKIEPFAFSYCGATQITLPSTIKEIGEYGFVNCNSLRNLTVRAEIPPVLGGYAFKFYMESNNVYEVSSILRINVPKSSVQAYTDAWSEYAAVISR